MPLKESILNTLNLHKRRVFEFDPLNPAISGSYKADSLSEDSETGGWCRRKSPIAQKAGAALRGEEAARVRPGAGEFASIGPKCFT